MSMRRLAHPRAWRAWVRHGAIGLGLALAACGSKTVVNKADGGGAGGTGAGGAGAAGTTAACTASGTPCATCLSAACCPELAGCRGDAECGCIGTCARACESEGGGLPCFTSCAPTAGPAAGAWNDLRNCANSRCSAQCSGAVSVVAQVASALPDCE